MRQLTDLENILQALIGEHERLLRHLDVQHAAMKKLDARAMDDAAAQAESARLRIVTLDTRRKQLVTQLAQLLRVDGQPTLARIAEAMPAAQAQSKKKLLDLRDKLKALVSHAASRAQLSGKLAGSVLGHLNTVVRLLAGAVEQAGIYTKHGTPRVSSRIGVMEAVG